MVRRYIRFMLGISLSHIVILGIILLLVGPKRLPEVGFKLGKALKNFKDAMSGIEEAKFRNLGSLSPDSKDDEDHDDRTERPRQARQTPKFEAPEGTVATRSEDAPEKGEPASEPEREKPGQDKA